MKRKLLIITLLLTLVPLGSAAQDEERPMMYMVANAHLDTQWRWDVRQTIGEFLPNTVLQNFALIEQYPDYIFNFEGAVKYSWIKEYYPYLYPTLKKYIQEGRWHPAGNSWDANDPNMVSVESAIRNLLQGHRYYLNEFGVKSTDIMLPDCFGFGWTLPSIAAHCGLSSFHTQKLQWRARPFYEDGRRFPFPFGIWQGIDGSRIMACLDGGNYSWDATTEDLTDFEDFKRRIAISPIPAVYRYFGTRSSRLHDDQGGSPTPASVRKFDQAMKHPGAYDLKFAASDEMFRDYYMDPRLPVFDGELLMDIHATGCYTSHSEMKKINRKNEWSLVSAEQAGVLSEWLGDMEYPAYTLDQGWKKLLVHQFHDDLTGTSFPPAYRFSYNDEFVTATQLASTLRAQVLAIAGSMDTRAEGIPVAVYNPVSARNCSVVKVTVPLPASDKGVTVTDPEGRKHPAQILSRDGSRALVAFAASSAPLSVGIYDLRPVRKAYPSSVLKVSGRTMENRIYKLTVDDCGDIVSIVDKRSGRELVREGSSFGFELFTGNESNIWPAWEILKPVLDRKPLRIRDNVRISMEENGPLRMVMKIEKSFGPSSFVQRIILTDGAVDDRIDIENEIDWQCRESLLKYSFPMNLEATEASYDLGMAHVRRGVSTDLKYEVYAHQWADMTSDDASWGITVMNDSKYGWDHPDKGTLRLTLLHTPTAHSYDSWQSTMDIGKHSFTFSIYSHEGVLDPVRVSEVADFLNAPAPAYAVGKHTGEHGRIQSLVASVSDGVRIKAMKRAEDGEGIVVRTYEVSGQGCEGRIEFCADILRAEELNGVEEYKAPAEFSGRVLKTSAPRFGLKTYRVWLKPSGKGGCPPVCQPVDLPYNVVAITSDAFSAFGHMDDDWHSYAAELIPGTLHYSGVPFRMGEADLDNALKCRAQKVSIPQGSKTVYLLAASSQGEREAVFDAGIKTSLKVPYYSGFYRYFGWEGHYEGEWHDGNVAYHGSHRHDSRTRNEIYTSTYMYMLEIPVRPGCTTLDLPDDDKVTVFAATALIQ